MKNHLKIVFIILLLLMQTFVFAQKEKIKNDTKKVTQINKEEKVILQSGIKVIAKAYGDSIVLRWAPTRPWAWNKLNYLGYTIERIDLNEKDNAKKELLTTVPLKPYSLEKFKTVFQRDNNNAAIAAQCLYGKNFETNLRQGQAAIADKSSVSDARYAYTLMVADYDANVGVATALRFTDKNVTKGGKYIYRIMPAGVATQGVIDTGTVLIINNKQAINSKPEITESLAFDRLGELHWDRTGAETWSGFYIERSEDGKVFKPLNKIPFITSPPDSALLKQDPGKARLFAMLQTQHIYIDSLPQNYKNYYYRIKGINAFAEMSDYSNIVTVSGRDLTPPVAVNMLNPKFISDRKMKVLWKKDIIERDCKGYYITRANNINGPYSTLNQQILPPTATEYIDNNAFEHGGSYYIVVAVDTANNISSSSPGMGLVPDNTPPAVPIGLKGRIEKTGLVYLSWDANKEEDVKGYKVYFANAADHVFTQITTEPDSLNSFVDSITLRTLTKDIWYKIVAVDFNNNHSEFSPAVKLRKPDIVPPTAPIATNVMVSKNSVDMDWIQSSSNDVVGYEIYRQQDKNENKLLARFKPNTTNTSFHFKDTTARTNLVYNYTAVAIDEDSLHSPASVAVQIKINANPERPAITTLKAIYDPKEKVIKLNWIYTTGGNYFFIIYRSRGDEPLERLQSFNKEINEYTDYTVTPGKTYHYAIQAIYKDANGNTKQGKAVDVIVAGE
jgi:fibronectin type 3 domain-containing protein